MDQRFMPNAESLLRLHDEATERWHVDVGRSNSVPVRGDGGLTAESSNDRLTDLILRQHRANFDLWHHEDETRDPGAADALIAEEKRTIDAINQRRNDLMEAVDTSLCARLRQHGDCPMHSETPGMILDRLSIMALKIYHTHEETERETATEMHREKNRARLALLLEQRSDLAVCLDDLMGQIMRGEKRFKVYRQMKMYNDPDLNPVLYRKGHS